MELAQLGTIFETAPIGLAVWDRDLRFVRVNAALAEMNGLTPEDHLGRRPSEILPDLEGIIAVERLLQQVMDTGEARIDVPVSGETPAAPGRMRYWLESFYPVRVGEAIVGVGAVTREVTAQRENEAFRRNVLGIVGHDLRSPLAAIGLSASLLESRLDDPDLQRQLERLQSNVSRMDRMIADLLDYSTARAGHGVPLTRAPADLDRICRAVVEDLARAHPEREIVYRGEGEGDGRGRWDAGRLVQVFENLVGNALKHGAPEVPVRCTWRGVGDTVVVEVQNGGPPIPHARLHDLFEPFRRGESQTQGHGLGLFIAREIVRSHGGTLAVRSSEKEGTVFSVLLPR